MKVPTAKKKAEHVYFIGQQWASYGVGLECINGHEIIESPSKAFTPLGGHHNISPSFKPMSGTPVLQFKGRSKKFQNDFSILGGIWLLSQPVREYFESVDFEAFEFRDCITIFPDGSPAPRRCAALVTRMIDAFDREKSEYEADKQDPTGLALSVSLNSKSCFKKSVIGFADFFSASYTLKTVVSQRVRDEFITRGWKGATFKKADLT